MPAHAQATDGFLAAFERFQAHTQSASAGWVRELRERGIRSFGDVSFRGPKNEDWQYAYVSSLVQHRFERVERDDLVFDEARIRRATEHLPAAAGAPVLVFVDGHYVADCSRVEGIEKSRARVTSLRRQLVDDAGAVEPYLGRYLDAGVHGFSALNTAFLDDGAFIELPAGVALAAPIHVLFYSTRRQQPTVAHPRVLVVAGKNSNATVVEHYVGEPDALYLTNTATEIVLAEGAGVAHARGQREATSAFHVARIECAQGRDSRFQSHAFSLGGGLSRTEIKTTLSAEGAECALYGLYTLAGRQHADHHTVVDHASPRTRSNELYKGVLDDHARGIFTGHVLVRPDAQKIQSQQTNKNLLLADGAIVETRPQLEIYADDVMCTHGAAIGRLDEHALFYMRARGISQHEARGLLTYAFASEIVDTLAAGALHAMLAETVFSRIRAAGTSLAAPTAGDGGAR